MCALIFRGLGLRISKVELAGYDRRVVVCFQKCRWADAEFFMAWGKRCYHKGERRCDAVGETNPSGRQLARAGDGRVQDPLDVCNTLLWLLPSRYTDGVQPIDAVYGRLLKVEAGKRLDGWLDVG